MYLLLLKRIGRNYNFDMYLNVFPLCCSMVTQHNVINSNNLINYCQNTYYNLEQRIWRWRCFSEFSTVPLFKKIHYITILQNKAYKTVNTRNYLQIQNKIFLNSTEPHLTAIGVIIIVSMNSKIMRWL